MYQSYVHPKNVHNIYGHEISENQNENQGFK